MKNKNLETVKWSLKIAWQVCPGKFLMWIGTSFLSVVLTPVILKVTSYVIDMVSSKVANGDTIQSFIFPVVMITLLLFLRGIYNLSVNMTKQIFVTEIQSAVAERIMEQSAKIPVKQFDDSEFVKMLYLCANSDNAENTGILAQGVISVFGRLATVAVLLIMAAQISGYFLAGTLVLLIISIFICVKVAKKRYQIEKESIMDGRWKEYFFSCATSQEKGREIRTLDLENGIVRKWRSKADPLRKKLLGIEYGKEKGVLSIDMLSALLSLIMLGLGVLWLEEASITFGTMFLIWQLSSEMQAGVKLFVNDFMEPYAAIPKVRDTQYFLELTFEEKQALLGKADINPQTKEEEKKTPFLELQDVSFGYKPGKTILHDINLKIREGEIVALCGTNGSGKTTLINVLTGMYQADSGKCFMEGREFSEVTRKEMASRMGVDFQYFMVFGFPLREEIALGEIELLPDEEKIKRALQRGGAEKLMNRIGLDSCTGTLYDVRGAKLSGGEYQRIGVSRAFMGDKKVLVLDEPAAMLDPIAEYEQFQQVRNAIAGQTAILISHRIGFARLADRIIVMDQGRIAEDGTHEELLKKKGLYYDMFEAQAEWYSDLKDEEAV